MTPQKNKLIVTAHDFGLCNSVNKGIVLALEHPNNIITEVSLLPNAPGSKEAARIARDLKISVCLCVNLTTFKPLSTTVPSMVDKNGIFLKVDVGTWNFSSFDSYTEKDVALEIDAQWMWFVENVGRKPTAIVTRKSEFGDPKVLLPLIKKAKKESVPVRTPVWMWKENYGAQSYAKQEGIKLTQHIFIGLKDWCGRFGYDLEKGIDALIKDINSAKGLSELLVFPGFVDEELFKLSIINWQRGQFLQILNKPEIIKKIKDNFELISCEDI